MQAKHSQPRKTVSISFKDDEYITKIIVLNELPPIMSIILLFILNKIKVISNIINNGKRMQAECNLHEG